MLHRAWHQKGKLALCTALGLALGTVYAFGVAVPRYPAVATLTTDWATPPDRATRHTQTVILGSRQVLGQVAGSLALSADPEFNPALPARDLMMRLDRALTRAPAPTTPAAQKKAVIDAIAARLQITNVNQSLAYDIRVQTRDPVKSAQLANTIALFYAARLDPTATGLDPRRAQLVSPAEARPAAPPGPGQILLIGALLGLALGAGWAGLGGTTATGFRTTSDLRRALGRPVLGALPVLPGRSRTDRLTRLRLHPDRAGADAFRQLRSAALLSDIDTPPQVMLITSSRPGEGRTTLTLGLAQTIAAQGKTVLVIEGDLRKRAFAGYFKTGETLELLDLLRLPGQLQPGVFPQNLLGADVISAGRLATAPGTLFSSEPFQALLAQARQRYDTVLIDGPAVLETPEIRGLGAGTDAILYAVEAGKTHQSDVTQGITLFEQAGLYLTGLILTRAKA
jgi:capsular exopolysaccharide synthesis family protein